MTNWLHKRTAWLSAVAAIIVLATWLRVDEIGHRSLSHPENFAPGLDVPSWVRFPPPRHDLVGVLRGTLIDGHPPTYFLALLPWVEAFGASLTSLRLPSALFGALSVALVFCVALREGGRWTAVLAAGLLALHGHHVYWSQLARMYTLAACLVLGSTLFLWRLRERGAQRDAWGFFACTALALWTQLYAWPLVFAQIVAALLLDVRDRRAPSALRTQLAAVVASTWVIQLSIYQDPPTRWQGSMSEYFQLGYLFSSQARFFGERPEAAFDGPWLLALGLALLAVALFARRSPALDSKAPPSVARGLPSWFEVGLVLGSTAALVGFALLAPPRARIDWTQIWVLCAVPLSVASGYAVFARRLAALTVRPPAWLARLAALDVPLSWQLAVVPALCMAFVSLARGVFVARGTIVFLPFLSLALAHGLVGLLRVRALGLATLVLVLGLHLASVRYFRQAESTPRDYAGLARKLLPELRPTDLVLVGNNFSYPPLLYYLRDVQEQCVPDEQPERVRAAGSDARIWLIEFSDPTSEELLALVADRRPTHALEVAQARAVLYESY